MQDFYTSSMDPDRWSQIETLYHAALQLDPSERDDFLKRECGRDDALRRELLALISSSDSADSFLEEPAVSLGLSVLGRFEGALVGQIVDRYTLIALLGRGGMGEVYLAHDDRLKRNVALKVLPSSITEDRARVRRFEQEARAASAISHPNVAHIYEIGEAQGHHFISMEYVAGHTLRQILKKGLPDVAKAVEIAIQVAYALSAAHEAKVIHRDIKPENIMLRGDGYVKVLDFGLAKLFENRDPNDDHTQTQPSLLTEPELLMGTSSYMSPEQVRKRAVDVRTDLWSWGVVFYEMLTGRRPFQGEGIGEIIVAILEQEPEPLAHVRPELPSGLQEIISKALRKNPEERYQTAEALLTDLRQAYSQIKSNGDSYSVKPDTSMDAEPADSIPPEKALETSEEQARETAGPIPPANFIKRSGDDERKPDANTSGKFFTLKNWKFQAVLAALILAAGLGVYYNLPARGARQMQSRSIDLRFERLNLSGNVSDMVISPDGQYIAAILIEEGKKSIHIMEVATSSDLQIIPPSGKDYSAVSFSPDGNYLYFLENQTETGTLYRVTKLGGGLRKILTNVNTAATFSPDGNQMGFIRYNFSDNTPDLVIARADGTLERVLTRRTRADADVFPGDMRGVGPAWAPVGNVLVCPTLNAKRNAREMNLDVIDIESGQSRRLNSRPWYDISRIAWLADGSGLLIAATGSANAPLQLTLVSYPGGEVRNVTNDPNNYSLVSGTSDSGRFLTLNVEENSSIWSVPRNGESQPALLNVTQKKGVSGVVYAPDGRLLYTVDDGKDINFWMREADSESVSQLTFEQSKNGRPVFTPDKRYVVFVSMRSGASNIWRIDADGTEPKQLTSGSYDDMPSVTPDGQWVVYRAGGSISKVSIDGGAPSKLLSFSGRSLLFPDLSPDGKLVAFFINDARDSQRWNLEVYDLNTLKQVKSFVLPEAARPFYGVRWTRDNQGLTYVSSVSSASNLWVQPLGGGDPKQVTDFKDAEIISFDWSASGDKIYCVRTSKTYIPVLVKIF